MLSRSRVKLSSLNSVWSDGSLDICGKSIDFWFDIGSVSDCELSRTSVWFSSISDSRVSSRYSSSGQISYSNSVSVAVVWQGTLKK